jgi:hypothetical protein
MEQIAWYIMQLVTLTADNCNTSIVRDDQFCTVHASYSGEELFKCPLDIYLKFQELKGMIMDAEFPMESDYAALPAKSKDFDTEIPF